MHHPALVLRKHQQTHYRPLKLVSLFYRSRSPIQDSRDAVEDGSYLAHQPTNISIRLVECEQEVLNAAEFVAVYGEVGTRRGTSIQFNEEVLEDGVVLIERNGLDWAGVCCTGGACSVNEPCKLTERF